MIRTALAVGGVVLAGVRWGRLAYGPAGRAKTVEGSLAFFSVALFCAFVPLVLLAGAGPGRALAIAVVLAFAATLFEAAAGDGLDNLTVPLGAFLVLGVLL